MITLRVMMRMDNGYDDQLIMVISLTGKINLFMMLIKEKKEQHIK